MTDKAIEKLEMKAKKLIKFSISQNSHGTTGNLLGRVWIVPGLPVLYEHVPNRVCTENAPVGEAWLKNDLVNSGRYKTLQELVIELLKYKQEQGL